jgi:hypothetical protein
MWIYRGELECFDGFISLVVDALPLQSRTSALNVAKCTDPSVKLVELDCNAALLGG